LQALPLAGGAAPQYELVAPAVAAPAVAAPPAAVPAVAAPPELLPAAPLSPPVVRGSRLLSPPQPLRAIKIDVLAPATTANQDELFKGNRTGPPTHRESRRTKSPHKCRHSSEPHCNPWAGRRNGVSRATGYHQNRCHYMAHGSTGSHRMSDPRRPDRSRCLQRRCQQRPRYLLRRPRPLQRPSLRYSRYPSYRPPRRSSTRRSLLRSCPPDSCPLNRGCRRRPRPPRKRTRSR
jgi:hypothetical protein